MRRATFLRGIGGTAALLAGSALGAGPSDAQGHAMTIGYQEQPDWLLFVARDMRLFEKAGIAASFVKFEAGPPMIEAVRNGSIDLASVGSVAFLLGLAQGIDWVMIGINPEGAYSQGLVAGRDSGIKTPIDLKGKRVGLFKGATAHFGFLMLLRQHGIHADQVTIIHMTPAQQLKALEDRQIDAAMVWEPWMQRMIHQANARIVETEGNLGIYTNVDCYSVQRSWLNANRDTVIRFLRALLMAADIVRKDPRIAYRIWSTELGLKAAWAEAIYNVVPPPLITEWTNPRYTYSLVKGAPLYQRLGFLANYLLQEKLISQPLDLSDVMDAGPITEVLKGRKPDR
jgi:aliphatic sulfonates family ABC transporter substrate-binding protein